MDRLEVRSAILDADKTARIDHRRLPFSFAMMCGLFLATLGVAVAGGIALRNLGRLRPGRVVLAGAAIGWGIGYILGRGLERLVARIEVGGQPIVVPQSWVFFGSAVGFLEGLVAGALLRHGPICALNAGACFGIGWGVFVSSLTWRCCQRFVRYQSAILLVGLLIESVGCEFLVWRFAGFLTRRHLLWISAIGLAGLIGQGWGYLREWRRRDDVV